MSTAVVVNGVTNIAIVAAALVGLCVLLYCFGACCWIRRRRQQKKQKVAEEEKEAVEKVDKDNSDHNSDHNDNNNSDHNNNKDEGNKDEEMQLIPEKVEIKPVAVASLVDGTRSPRVHPVEVNVDLGQNIDTINPPVPSSRGSSRMMRSASKRGRPPSDHDDDIESNTSEPVLLKDMGRGTE